MVKSTRNSDFIMKTMSSEARNKREFKHLKGDNVILIHQHHVRSADTTAATTSRFDTFIYFQE